MGIKKEIDVQFNKMKKEQKKYRRLLNMERVTCPHIGKSGKPWLKEFTEGDIKKAKCKECGEIIIVDKELLSQESILISADIIRTALAELKAQNHIGKIELDKETTKLISEFDAEVLRDLPKLMQKITNDSEESGRTKDKKKSKNKKQKANKRRRWI